MSNHIVILLPILFPVFAGILLLLTDWFHHQKKLRIYAGTVLGINAGLVLLNLTGNDASLTVWEMSSNMKIYFQIDGLSVLFGLLVTVIWVLVGFYSFTYMHHEQREKRFFGFYLITFGVLMGILFSGNIITMYIFYEIMTLVTFPLVVHSQTKEAMAAGFKYLFYSLAGAFMGLFGIFFLFHYNEGMAFLPGGTLNQVMVSGNETILLLSVFLMILGFGTKAGMFPLHGWLPTAHPVAPAPASAALSGIITKMGIFCIIRLIFYVVGTDFIRGTWVQYAWIILSLITVFMGSMLAYKEKVTKKRLAYSSVSQLSYILFGLSLLNMGGFCGAMMHVVFHALIKNALFLVAGAIIFKTGKTRVEDLTGIGKEMPVTMWCYTIVSLGLIGIPPLSGFISKWYLATGAMESNIGVFSYLGPAVLLISALLTAGYLLPITVKGFFPGEDYDYHSLKKMEPSSFMTVPIIILTAGTILFGLFPSGLYQFISNLAGLIF